MNRDELSKMVVDMDRLGNFVNQQMAIMPTESAEKAGAAETVRAVKSGLVRLIEAHDKSIESLKNRIEGRKKHEEVH